MYYMPNPSNEFLSFSIKTMKEKLAILILALPNITFASEYSDFLSKFDDNHKIIWCINTKTLQISQINGAGNCFKWKDYQNIVLPPKTHVARYFEVYDTVDEVIRSFPTENIESWFNENAWNAHAFGYVQTLRKYEIPWDIVSQLTWKKNRQDAQIENKRQCWYYEDWSEAQIKCVYRYHYHASKWYYYADKSYVIYEYYKQYFNR